jgi:hypothetical protein
MVSETSYRRVLLERIKSTHQKKGFFNMKHKPNIQTTAVILPCVNAST